jgi:hypothetical protein
VVQPQLPHGQGHERASIRHRHLGVREKQHAENEEPTVTAASHGFAHTDVKLE